MLTIVYQKMAELRTLFPRPEKKLDKEGIYRAATGESERIQLFYRIFTIGIRLRIYLLRYDHLCL